MDSKQNWLERPIHPALPNLTNEIVIFAAVILLAIVTRFYDLGARVMSHDESLHTYFSWLLYRGQGYEHSPMMHGPFQFHSIALSYFLFGANDFTSRIPSVVFSIATIWMVWYWRRYLGKWGAMIAGLLLVISPYMLYYGRYVRNESFVGFSGILMLYAMLRHLESGGKKYLFMLAAALALHFTAKETAFIYTAQALIFIAIYFIVQVTRRSWEYAEMDYRAFIIALSAAVLLLGATVGYGLYNRDASTLTGTQTAMPAAPGATTPQITPTEAGPISLTLILALAAVVALGFAAFFLIRGYTWEKIRAERSFELLMTAGLIVLPMLSPFPVKWLEGWLHVTIPSTAPEVQAMMGDTRSILIIVGFLATMFAISVAAGLIWNREKWWQTSLVFWVPYTVFYTTVFTKGAGFFTGTIGSLGYWLVQQGVQRGSQPWYYYLLIQIPIYEFLPALGLILAIIIGLRRSPAPIPEEEDEVIGLLTESNTEEKNFPNMFSLLVWWSISSVIALTYAGERMPWLTYHMAWPMILITGWALGHLIDTTDWEKLKEQRIPLTLAVLAIFIIGSTGMMLSLSSTTPPFQGKGLEQLQANVTFLLPMLATILSAVGATWLLRNWTFQDIRHIFTLVFFMLLAVLTGRAAFRASYITYDQATEFLVYAHGATGIKQVMAQAQEISERTTNSPTGVSIAYDASAPDTGVSWPFVWYLRDYTKQSSFDKPTRSLRDSTMVIVDEKNFDKIDAALGTGFYRMDYIRMWWPMQDYFNLSFDRDPTQPFPPDYACKGLLSPLKSVKTKDFTPFCEAFTNPAIRAGIVQIWLDRDYTKYAAAKGRTDLTLTTWSPADKMRLYIKKDVAAQIWNYGVSPATQPKTVDPTEGKYIALPPDRVLTVGPTPLNAPRSLAIAKDGTIYVADTRNHRVVHMNTEGTVLQEWGSFADGVSVPIGNGTFNEPWGIAIGPDNSIYVTDTWNHRIEKFAPDGKFLTAWGVFGQGQTPDSFYGPRGLAMDSEGRLFVTDTGNKRVVVFDENGNFITQFGAGGMDPGQFDEPVGIAVDKNGKVYVVDTWNQRIQTFSPIASQGSLSFTPDAQWDVYGWFGQSVNNKPFIAVNDNLNVFITDPDGFRTMEFDSNGTLLRVWDGLDSANSSMDPGTPSGIAVDMEGHIWITDSTNNRLMRFTLP